MSANRSVGLEKQNGWDVGRDPREMARAELELLGHGKKPLLRAIRARCLDCCAGQPNEARLCTSVHCPLWAYRMATDPWRKEPSEAQRAHARTLAAKRRAEAGRQPSGGRESAKVELPATNLPPARLSTGETPVLGRPRRRAAGGGETVR
ncbi:MAG TPA: hypothetical protein VES39_06925 [Rhodospirillales bacterium]|nr:hypothetical protein [Rhodospirillales bacterium]